ncbi:YARHG domain-containing protein [Croceimicrobium sp.]|uniref:YARHG domain-containing protein n=1 Tax=Croceimicrobium sp. TaxID=2828340 RepID=UPI003BACA92A
MKIHLAVVLTFISCSYLSGQYYRTFEIPEDQINTWIPKISLEYQGIYHFGESESESSLRLFFEGKMIVGQISQGYWEDSTGFWKLKYTNLTNVKIDKQGNFSSDQYSGRFVHFSENSHKGLRIDNPWTEWIPKGKYEIGYRTATVTRDFPGKYPELSYRHLSKEELTGLSKKTLQRMRNEIYARYGYRFKSGSKMEKYFSKQDWYFAQHDDVSSFLSPIELDNIALIQKVESLK